MAEKPRIFLSAVTKELGSIRDQLAVELRRRGCEVAVQEEFRTTSGTLLEKLHDYILECHAVVCLMGGRYGAEPPSAEATRYAFSFTKDGPETGVTPRHSYTQWEYLFARRMNKATFVFLPSKTAPRDPSHTENPEPEDLQQLQQHFIQKDVRLDGRDRTTFDSLEQLKDHLAAIDFQKLLHAEYHQVPLKTGNPYIGLRHFKATERDYFFGRDRLIAELIAAMDGSPLLMVLGASGSGKSSAVRAGLIPSWWERTGKKGRVVKFTPDEDAFEGFYLGLNRAGYSQNEAKPAKTPSPNVIRERFDALHKADEPWLIFIDQFEQIFTRTPEREEAKKVAFIAALVDVASDPPEGLRVVLAMRDDFFSNLEGFPELFAITDKHFRRVARMDEGELRAVIQRPAASHGVAFEPGLIRLILDDLADSRGRLPLPYLQYTLKALWEEDKPTDRVLNIDSYKRIGGVKGALQQRVTSYFKGLGAADQQSLRRILLRLVEIGETQVPVSRAARKADLATGNDAVVLEQLLSEQKLLVAQEGGGDDRADSVVELAHEALITGWDEFEKWVNESREAISLRNRLREDAEAWCVLRDSKSAADRRNAPGELWTGSRLERALELRNTGDFERIGGLSKRESAFLDESERQKKWAVIVLRRRLAIVSLLTVAAIVAGGYAWNMAKVAGELNKKANEQVQEAATKAWGAARQAFDKEGDARVGFARLAEALRYEQSLPEEWRRDRLREDAILRLRFAQGMEPQRLAVLRHEDNVYSACFSHDGTRVVTSGRDGTARIWDVATGEPLGEPLRHENWFNTSTSASFSPDGTRVMTTSGDSLHTARIWDAATGELVGEPLRHEAKIQSESFSPDGSLVVTASRDNNARIWDVATGEPIGEPLRHEDGVMEANFSPDGTRVVTASADNTARIWDVATREPVGEPLRHEAVVYTASFSPDGTRVVTASADNTARIWDVATGEPVGEPLRHEGVVHNASFSPDGTRVVTASADNTARIWDAASGEPVGEPLRHGNWVLGASFSPDATRVVTASWDNTARIWDVATGEPIGEPLRHEDGVMEANFSPDGTRVVTASADNTARIWSAETVEPICKRLLHDMVMSASFTPDGTGILTLSEEDIARIWDAATGDHVGAFFRHEGPLKSASFSNDGTRVVNTRGDNTARIWDAATGELVGEPLRHEAEIWVESFSPDGALVLTTSADNTARIWDVATGEPIGEPLRHEDGVMEANFSPDGTRVVTASRDNNARIWDVATGEPVGESLRHEDTVITASFCPDGIRVVTASADTTARIWDAATGEPLGEPLQHEDVVRHASFSPDGTRVLTASNDRTARIWNTATRAPLGKPLRHEDYVNCASFSPDGTLVVTASADKTARVWDVATGETVGEPLRHEADVTSASFSHNGTRIVTAGKDDTARVWDIKLDVAEELVEPKYFEIFGGWRIDPLGAVKEVPFAERLQIREELGKLQEKSSFTELVRARLEPEARNADRRRISRWNLNWVASHPEKDSSSAIVRSLLQTDPGHPLLPLALAVVETDTTRRRFLSERWNDHLEKQPEIGESETASRLQLRLYGEIEDGERFETLAKVILDNPDSTLQTLLSVGKGASLLKRNDIVSLVLSKADSRFSDSEDLDWLRWKAGVIEPELALGIWQQVIAKPEATFHDFITAGDLAAELKDADTSMAIFEQSLERFPEDSGHLNYRFGEALRTLGREEEALPRMQMAVSDLLGWQRSFAYQESFAYKGLAEVLQSLNRPDEAWQVWQMLVALEDAPVDHLTDAFYFAAQNGHAEAARTIIDTALKQAKDRSERGQVQRMAGWSYLKLNDAPAARSAFEAARETLENGSKPDPNLLAGLAIALWLTNDRDAAIANYRQLIETGRSGEEPKDWADSETIDGLSSPDSETIPLEQIRAATLERHPELIKNPSGNGNEAAR